MSGPREGLGRGAASVAGPWASAGSLGVMGGALVATAGAVAAARVLRAGLAGVAEAQALAERRMRRPAAQAFEQLEDLFAEARAAVAEDAVPAVSGEEAAEALGPVILGRAERGGPAPARPPSAAVAHASGRRLRLVLARDLPDADLALLADRAAGLPGVTRAVVRAASLSLIVEGDAPATRLAERLEAAGLVTLLPGRFPEPAELATRLALTGLDTALRLRSGGAVSLRVMAETAAIGMDFLARNPGLARLPPGSLAERLAAEIARRRAPGA